MIPMLKHCTFCLFLFCLLSIASTDAQTNVGLKTVDIDGEKVIDQNRIEGLAYQVLNAETDQKKDSLNTVLKEILKVELSKTSAFHTAFDKVTSISILTPEDSAFRMFNWNIPYSEGNFSFECGILLPQEDLIYLDNSKEAEVIADSLQSWIPALYYSLIPKQTKFTTYYTLLGWKGNNRLTTKKVIDVLWLSNNGKVKFSAPIFHSQKVKRDRVVFEFAAQNAMKLTYNSKFDRIEFDHLSPPKQSLTGVYEYYGPDLSFDAYHWESEAWVLKEDIDLDQGLKKKKAEFEIGKENLLEERPIYQPK